MASVAQGVFEGKLPWNYIFIGMVVAVAIIILDLYLESRGSTFRTPVLAVAIGIYLPFELAVPIFAGGLIHQAVRFYQKRTGGQDEVEGSSRNGLLFASGLITGEALMGILMAIPIVILAKLNISLPLWKMPMGAIVGIVLLIGVAYWLYRTALSKK
jgi:putative OPT family oligopeptide transporter